MTTLGLPLAGANGGFPGSSICQSSPATAHCTAWRLSVPGASASRLAAVLMLDGADRLEADVGLQERARDLVEAVGERLVVHDGGRAHPRQSVGDAPAQLREHHLDRRFLGSDGVVRWPAGTTEKKSNCLYAIENLLVPSVPLYFGFSFR
jgi:hypothetical protein